MNLEMPFTSFYLRELQLINLQKDYGETDNLKEEYPDNAKGLHNIWKEGLNNYQSIRQKYN